MAATITDERGVITQCPGCGKKNRIPFERLGETGQCGGCHVELRPLSEPADVGSASQFDRLVANSRLPILVDFWAPWCGPCRMVAPEMVKVAASNAGRLLVLKVNTEAVPELANRFGISSIPTMAVFSAGREVARTSGARPAQAIEAWARKAVGR